MRPQQHDRRRTYREIGPTSVKAGKDDREARGLECRYLRERLQPPHVVAARGLLAEGVQLAPRKLRHLVPLAQQRERRRVRLRDPARVVSSSRLDDLNSSFSTCSGFVSAIVPRSDIKTVAEKIEFPKSQGNGNARPKELIRKQIAG